MDIWIGGDLNCIESYDVSWGNVELGALALRWRPSGSLTEVTWNVEALIMEIINLGNSIEQFF